MQTESVIFLTPQEQEGLPKPLELMQLEVLEKRGGLTTDNKKQLWIQRMGYQGEQIFYDFITKYKKPHWKVFYRTWLNINGRVECDFIVATKVSLYFFEIKNYSGSFIYENHQQFINNRRFKGDIFNQFKQMRERTSDMCEELNYSGGITHKLVYINPYYTANFPQEWQNFLLHFNRLNDFFDQMQRQETILPLSNLSAENFDAMIQQQFLCPAPYQVTSIPSEQLSKLQSGIECKHCGSFSLEMTRYNVKCNHCHQSEVKREAIQRLFNDYWAIYPNASLNTASLFKLNDGFFPESYLYKQLKNETTYNLYI